jgi:hypothetical protein
MFETPRTWRLGCTLLAFAALSCGPQEVDAPEDLTPPTVEVTSSPNASFDGSYTLTGVARDDVGVERVFVKVGGDDPITAGLEPDGSFAATLFIPPAGASVVVQAQDAARNAGEARLELGRGAASDGTLSALYDIDGTPFAGELLELDARVTENPSGEPLTYRWDIEGGGPTIETRDPRLRWRFDDARSYAVELEVESSDGQTDTYRSLVAVVPPKAEGERVLRVRARDEEGRVLDGARVSIARAPWGVGDLREGTELGVTDRTGVLTTRVPANVPLVLEVRHGETAPSFVHAPRENINRASWLEVALTTRDDPSYADGQGAFASSTGGTFTPDGAVTARPGEVLAVDLLEVGPEDEAMRLPPGGNHGVDTRGRLADLSPRALVWLDVHGADLAGRQGELGELTVVVPGAVDGAEHRVWWYSADEGAWVERARATTATRGGVVVATFEVDARGWWMLTGAAASEALHVTLRRGEASDAMPATLELVGDDGGRAEATVVPEDGAPTLTVPWSGGGATLDAYARSRAGLLHGSTRQGPGAPSRRELTLTPLTPSATLTPNQPLNADLDLPPNQGVFVRARTDNPRHVLTLTASGGAAGEVVVRDGRAGRPVARFSLGRGYTFAPGRAGAWWIELRSPEATRVTLDGEVTEGLERLPAGPARIVESAPGGDADCFGVWTRRGHHVAGHVGVFEGAPDSWLLELSEPDGAPLGTLASSSGDLAPARVDVSGERLLCVRAVDPDANTRLFSVRRADVRRDLSFATGAPRDVDHAFDEPGDLVVMPYSIPPERHYRLGAHQSTPSTPLPRVEIRGDVASPTPGIQRAARRTLGVTRAGHARGAIFVSAEAQGDVSITLNHVPTSDTFKAGDPRTCEGADGMLELGARAVGSGGTLLLCPGIHYLDEPLRAHANLLGDEENGSRIITPAGSSLIAWSGPFEGPLEVARIRYTADLALDALIRVEGLDVALELDDLTLDTNALSRFAAIEVEGAPGEGSSLSVSDLKVGNDDLGGAQRFSAGVTTRDVGAVTIERAELLRIRHVGVSVSGATERAVLKGSDIRGYMTEHAARFDVAGEVVLERNTLEVLSIRPETRDLVHVALRTGPGGATGLNASENHFEVDASGVGQTRAGLYVLVDQEGASVRVNRNRFLQQDIDFTPRARDLLVIETAGSIQSLGDLEVASNVVRDPLGPLVITGAERYASITLAHNSATMALGLSGPLFTLEGTGGALTFANNAIDFGILLQGVPERALSLDPRITLGGGSNFYSTWSPIMYAGPDLDTLPGDLSGDPRWNRADDLRPGPGSMLIDAGLGLPELVSAPFGGGDRVQGAAPDIGAWEQ